MFVFARQGREIEENTEQGRVHLFTMHTKSEAYRLLYFLSSVAAEVKKLGVHFDGGKGRAWKRQFAERIGRCIIYVQLQNAHRSHRIKPNKVDGLGQRSRWRGATDSFMGLKVIKVTDYPWA